MNKYTVSRYHTYSARLFFTVLTAGKNSNSSWNTQTVSYSDFQEKSINMKLLKKNETLATFQ